jgi:hypothetical protein
MNPSDLIEAELSFAVDLKPLLSPLPEGDGVGVSLRTDPLWQQIRDAQHEDDPSLRRCAPMHCACAARTFIWRCGCARRGRGFIASRA